MNTDIRELQEEVSNSPLYSEDLAPIPKDKRSWGTWDLAAIWVGMAVCIPTYLLASYMITQGISWYAALIIIALANLIITVPMVLNGHGGVKYGIPFPVIGRAAFGTNGIHIASVVRGIVACGWFGIQTWIGGLAFYEIWHAIMGTDASMALGIGQFIGFALFWLINMYIIWKGIETIRWLEDFAAPILILMGLFLIGWGAWQAGGFGIVLDQSKQLEKASAMITQSNEGDLLVNIHPIKDKEGQIKAAEYRLSISPDEAMGDQSWRPLPNAAIQLATLRPSVESEAILAGNQEVQIQLRATDGERSLESQIVAASLAPASGDSFSSKFWQYFIWLNVMVGFWATMSISIADITRYASTQEQQVKGQFIGLPGAMVLYSFVGIFVTCAAVINFKDVLIAADAPWDPITLLGKFDSPTVVIISQIFMIIATLSTNIAANVIAPSNAFSNILPKRLSFRAGGVITGILGIVICPWLLLNEISSLLIFVSGLLGPVLGILICDYFIIRKKELQLAELYKTNGIYAFGGSGFNPAAMIALGLGVLVALLGFWIPSLSLLYDLSWFSGFAVSFGLYWLLMGRK